MVTFAHGRPARLQDARTGRCRAGLLSLCVVMLLSACTLQPIVPDTPTPAPEQEAGIELHLFRPLEMSPVGDVWTGGIVEYTQDGHMLPMEILIFRRGNIASYIISFGRIDTPVEQSAQDLASALDDAIVEYLAAK